MSSLTTPQAPAKRIRRWRHTPAEKVAAIRVDYLAGKKYKEIMRVHDISSGAVSNATHDLPRRNGSKAPAPALKITTPPKPVREGGESKQHYAARIVAWKGAVDPTYKARVAAARAEGQRRYKKLRHEAALRAARKMKRLAKAVNALKAAPPAPAPEVREVIRYVEVPAPVTLPPPRRPGFLRSIGRALGLVR